MSQFFRIHPENPQLRLINQATEIVKAGGVIAYPTDSAYALGCHIGDKRALQRIRQIRRLDERHAFTLVCRDLSGNQGSSKAAGTCEAENHRPSSAGKFDL